MNYYDQLKGTIQGAPNITAGAPILGGPAELQAYNNINFQLPVSNAATSVLGDQTAVQNTISENNIKKQMSDVSKKMSGEGYQRKPKPDGGYAFFDPNGNQISAYEYARATGKNSSEVLADSQNPIDIQYQEDYSGLQNFLAAVSTGDRETMNAYYAENPELERMSPQEVIQKFKLAYPTVYGTTNTGQRLGSTYIPRNSAVENRLAGAADTGIGE